MRKTAMDPPAVPVEERRGVGPVSGDDSAMRVWAEELAARAREEGVELIGDNGLLTGLVRRVLQTGLEVEMSEHLGYDRHAAEGGSASPRWCCMRPPGRSTGCRPSIAGHSR